MTDITEHPTREGKLYSCVVLDAFSRFVVGWAIDCTQTTTLVLNALGIAIRRRNGQDGLVIHSDRGVTSSRLGRLARTSPTPAAPRGWTPVGSPYDNAMVEAFWGRMQVELLNRRRWKTRIEFACALHDYIELFHNPRRRHSTLRMLTPSNTRSSTPTPPKPPEVQQLDSTKAGQSEFPSDPARLTAPA